MCWRSLPCRPDAFQSYTKWFFRAQSQGDNLWQTQVMALSVSRSSSIFLWTQSHLSAIKRLTV